MTKVYLVIESEGEWEDYKERIIDARFDKSEAERIISELNKELEESESRLEELNNENLDCPEEYSEDDFCKSCPKQNMCEEYGRLSEMSNYFPYRIKEIEVK